MYACARYASHHINSNTENPIFDGIQMGLTITSFPTGVWSTKVHASDDKQIPFFFFYYTVYILTINTSNNTCTE